MDLILGVGILCFIEFILVGFCIEDNGLEESKIRGNEEGSGVIEVDIDGKMIVFWVRVEVESMERENRCKRI